MAESLSEEPTAILPYKLVNRFTLKKISLSGANVKKFISIFEISLSVCPFASFSSLV
jgi:hypothetical protein